MCIIIDTNQLSNCFGDKPTKAARPVMQWVRKRSGCIVYGGKQQIEEIKKVRAAVVRLAELKIDGLAIEIDKSKIAEEAKKIRNLPRASNDLHILALARASGAKLLFSMDKKLGQDFKNRKLVKVRGSVYQGREEHRNLLKPSACPFCAVTTTR
jgi:predicted nucleic acid-binding protein